MADLNSVARGYKPIVEICDIGEIIAAHPDAASATTKNHNVQISLKVSEGIRLPLMRSCMERVFFNLIANAFEAMPNGGKLHIVCRKANSYVNRTLAYGARNSAWNSLIGCSNRSSQQASRTALGLGWPFPGRLLSTTAATFGLSPPPALVLSFAFP